MEDGTRLHLIFKRHLNKISPYEILSHYVEDHLWIESWGRPYIADCEENGWMIKNIQNLKFPNGIEWECTKDHSKWAIT